MSASPAPDKHAGYNKPKLFVLSVIALATAGMAFGIRGDIGGSLQSHFFDPIEPANSARLIGEVVGILFLGFAFAIAIGSPLLDFFGMGRLLGVSSLCFTVGTLIVLFADNLSGNIPVYWLLWTGMLLTGI